MSRTKNAAELCALVVEDTYGELSSRIVTLLMRRGRLSIPSLVQHTRLKPHQLRHGLAVLIQQNLVYHHLDKDTQITFYEANQDAIYLLLRSGKIIDAVQSRYGNLARDVIRELLLVGSIKIGALSDEYASKHQNGNIHVNGNANRGRLVEDKVNGNTAHTADTSQSHFDDVLCQLIEGGFIERVDASMFVSPTDTYNQVQRQVLQESYGGSTKGTKQKEELVLKIRDSLGDIRSERENALKRATVDVLANVNAKRRKLSNGEGMVNGSHSYESEGPGLNRDLIIRVNYEKCTVALRNERLIALAGHEIGATTSRVYGEYLKLLEPKIPRCQLNPNIDNSEEITGEGPSISTLTLTQAMSKSIDLADGVGTAGNREINTTRLETSRLKRKHSADESEVEVDGEASADEEEQAPDNDDHNGNIAEVDQESDSLGEDAYGVAATTKPQAKKPKVTFESNIVSQEDRQNRMTETNKHLLLLAEHSPSFIVRCGGGGRGEWTVDFNNLIDCLRETELDTFIYQAFGEKGHRIARILRQKGKLDEKQIQKFGLLKQKDVRTKLVEMQMAGFVDIQEVPRDNNRTPSRTIFLWYFDTERVTAILLDKIYKTMARHLQTLKAKKLEFQDILSLVARTDVRGHEDDLLVPAQLNRWHKIRDAEEQILAEVARLDQLVAIFRDY